VLMEGSNLIQGSQMSWGTAPNDPIEHAAHLSLLVRSTRADWRLLPRNTSPRTRGRKSDRSFFYSLLSFLGVESVENRSVPDHW